MIFFFWHSQYSLHQNMDHVWIFLNLYVRKMNKHPVNLIFSHCSFLFMYEEHLVFFPLFHKMWFYSRTLNHRKLLSQAQSSRLIMCLLRIGDKKQFHVGDSSQLKKKLFCYIVPPRTLICTVCIDWTYFYWSDSLLDFTDLNNVLAIIIQLYNFHEVLLDSQSLTSALELHSHLAAWAIATYESCFF